MKKLLLILLINFYSYSQTTFCEYAEITSKMIQDKDYLTALELLQEFKADFPEKKNIIEYQTALASYHLGYIDKAVAILENLIEIPDQSSSRFELNTCAFRYEENDKTYYNLFSKELIWRQKVKVYELLSDIARSNNEYAKALELLETSLKIKRQNKQRYSCGNAAQSDILNFERKRFDLLVKLEKYKEANDYGSQLLLYTTVRKNNPIFLDKILKNLQKEYTISEIKEELNTNINHIKQGNITINGIHQKKWYYIIFFRHKIFVPFISSKNLSAEGEKLKKRKNYQYIMNYK
ncbi:hypothetical protein [uncultured Aquimarina sp.]|uniref:hypothetical protein n=1 Tax=uncultured Aquimarina sp. TaxID=575652 RepID=UPI00260CBC74|nr:hypothetical protein [uncultured Aquimarina sp.]